MRAGLVLAVVVLAIVAVPVMRYVWADPETRRSMGQAWLIRWRWPRLSRMLGLVAVDPMPGLLSSLLGRREREGGRSRPPVLVPRLRVRADELRGDGHGEDSAPCGPSGVGQGGRPPGERVGLRARRGDAA